MSSDIIPFKKEHLKHLLSQDINKHDRNLFSDEFIEQLEKTNIYFTIVYKNKICVCGGIVPYWSGRGEIWSMFSEESRINFVAVFRAIGSWVRHQLKTNYQRIEVSIKPEFLLARRRVEALGFKLEIERAKKYLPSGEDCSIYSIVRE